MSKLRAKKSPSGRGGVDWVRRLHYISQISRLAIQGRLFRRYKCILLVSHMRSGSSLLLNLLTDHEEIAGFGEAHQSYHRQRDFLRLIAKTQEFGMPSRKAPRYFLDKILHEHHQLSKEWVRRKKPKVIILLRNPLLSLASLEAASFGYGLNGNITYLKSRISSLADLAATLPSRPLVLFYENLTSDFARVSLAIRDYLALGSDLNTTYSPTKLAGVEGYGDPSANILRGEIITRCPGKDAERIQLLLGSLDVHRADAVRMARHYTTCAEAILDKAVAVDNHVPNEYEIWRQFL